MIRRRCGAVWDRDGDGWAAVVDRYTLRTWKFGDIWQCVVDVVEVAGKRDGSVRICLPPQETRTAAMARAMRWTREYQGPISVSAAYERSFRDWPDLYKTRIDVIQHLLFVIGNGYDWLDGGIVSADQADESERAGEREFFEKRHAELSELRRTTAKLDKEVSELLGTPRAFEDVEEEPEQRPLPDDGKPRDFYPVSEGYSLVCRVPDNVTPDWLFFAWEGACLLRDRSEGKHAERNRAIGKKIVMELHERFAELHVLKEA